MIKASLCAFIIYQNNPPMVIIISSYNFGNDRDNYFVSLDVDNIMNMKKLHIILSLLFLSLSISQDFSGVDVMHVDENITLYEVYLALYNPDSDECVALDAAGNDGCLCSSEDGNDEDCEFNDYDACVDAGCDWWCNDGYDDCNEYSEAECASCTHCEWVDNLCVHNEYDCSQYTQQGGDICESYIECSWNSYDSECVHDHSCSDDEYFTGNPSITNIYDIPEDQGGRVYLDFTKSYYDQDGLSRIESYQIERTTS